MTQHESTDQPHRDAAAWASLVETLESGTLLAAISASMSERLKRYYSVEDLWQETLAMAWRDRERHDWTGFRSYRAWVLAIARNRVRDAVDVIDAQKRGGNETIEAFSTLVSDDESVGAILPAGSTTPSRAAVHGERVRAMESALAALPEGVREVVRLSLFDELPIREVAGRLGLSPSTAKRRLLEGAGRYRGELEARLGIDRG